MFAPPPKALVLPKFMPFEAAGAVAPKLRPAGAPKPVLCDDTCLRLLAMLCPFSMRSKFDATGTVLRAATAGNSGRCAWLGPRINWGLLTEEEPAARRGLADLIL